VYPYGLAQGIPCLGFQIWANDNGVPGIGTEPVHRVDKNFTALGHIYGIRDSGDPYGYPGRTSEHTNLVTIIGPYRIIDYVFVKKQGDSSDSRGYIT
jgi:hypothetical protein